MEDLLQVGIITQPHGIKGEVKVYPTTDQIERFHDLKEVLLSTKKETISLHVEGVKFFKGMVILKFKEFQSRDDVELFRKCPLMVTRENAIPLNEGEYFISDIIGLQVITEDNKELGKLEDVIQTGANDVYLVKNKEREILIPAIKDCILEVNLEEQYMKVHLLQGLLDL